MNTQENVIVKKAINMTNKIKFVKSAFITKKVATMNVQRTRNLTKKMVFVKI